jgi:erythromycin esterase-like protein
MLRKDKITTYLYLLLILTGLNNSVFAQQSADKYNLFFSYNKESDFIWHKGDKLLMRIDSTALVNGKYPLCIEQSPSIHKFLHASPLLVLFFQEFLIPDDIDNEAQLILYAKTKNLTTCVLKSIRIGKNEDVIGQDSVIINHEDWSADTLHLSLEKTNRLLVGIFAVGTEDSLKRNDAMEAIQGPAQKLWLDRMEILSDGQDISHKFMSTLTCSDKLQDDYITPLDTVDLYQNISISEGKKVVALGESVHGSSTIEYYKYELIKKLILENKCRLVLLESPITYTPYWNLLIQGKLPEEKLRKTIVQWQIMSGNFNGDQMTDFFLWLREFNLKASENDKVYIAGNVDATFPELVFNPLYETICVYHDKLNNQSSTISNESDKDIIYNLMRLLAGRMQAEEALIYMEKNTRHLKDVMGNLNYDIFYYTLSRRVFLDTLKTSEQVLRNFQSRDYFMFQNSQWFMRHCLADDCIATVSAHWGHTDKKNTSNIYPYIYSMGYYFQKYYGDSYFNIGFTVGIGEILSLADSAILQLKYPIDNSLEKGCMEKNFLCFYYYDPKRNSLRMPCRYTGNGYALSEFSYQGDISMRTDAFIFIRESKVSPEQRAVILHKGLKSY